jgi:hypothetical protein
MWNRIFKFCAILEAATLYLEEKTTLIYVTVAPEISFPNLHTHVDFQTLR